MLAKQAKNKKNKGRPPPPEKSRWKPGQSGNPKGRPKSALSCVSVTKDMLEWKAPEELIANFRRLYPQLGPNPTNMQISMLAGIIHSFDIKSGDGARSAIVDRIDGKVPIPIGPVNGSDAIPVALSFEGRTRIELEGLERTLLKWIPQKQE